MITRVVISKKHLADFRSAAIQTLPHERLWSLWGRIQGDTAIVTGFKDVPQKGTNDEVTVQIDDMFGPAAGPEQYIGTIHSHPSEAHSGDASPSEQDWDDAFATGEHVFGVMRIWRDPKGKYKTQLRWWEPRAAIRMIHPKTRTVGLNAKTKQRENKTVQPALEETVDQMGVLSKL